MFYFITIILLLICVFSCVCPSFCYYELGQFPKTFLTLAFVQAREGVLEFGAKAVGIMVPKGVDETLLKMLNPK